MKQKILLSLVFVCAFMVTTRAQISKGAVMVGGSIGYGQSKSGSDTPYLKNNTVSISPAVGLVVKDNLVVGISLLYNHGKIQNNYLIPESKNNTYGAGIFVRQYIPIVSRLYFFGEADASYQNTKGEITSINYQGVRSKSTTKTWIAGLAVTPGISYAVTKKFHLETSFNNILGVSYLKSETTTAPPAGSNVKSPVNKDEEFTAGISSGGKVQFSVGCRFLL